MSSKITIIGAGSVGATIAYTLSQKSIASEIVLIDINKQKAEGEVMDIDQGTSFREPISIVAGDYPDAAPLPSEASPWPWPAPVYRLWQPIDTATPPLSLPGRHHHYH